MLTPEQLHERFPYAQYHEEHQLMAWFPTGVLTNERADQAVDFMELAEQDGRAFNRYMDMTGYARMQLGFDHIVRLARRRRNYNGPPVKSAFFAERLISRTIANLYAELMDGSKIQVSIFRERTAAARWLGVPVEILQAPEPVKPSASKRRR